MDGSHGTETRALKRRRIPNACVPCRTRKSRCDGARPTCQACGEFGYECKYTQPGGSSNVIVGKDYLEGIQERLEAVEQSLLRTNARLDQVQTPIVEPVHTRDSLTHDSCDERDDTDAMGAVVFADETESGYFGPSSNISFLKTIADIMLQECDVSLRSPEDEHASKSAEGWRNPSQPPHNVESSDTSSLQEPTVDEEPELIDGFFSNAGYLFPYVHERLFRRKYHLMHSGQPSRSWLGLLNIVLAMSISTNLDRGLTAPQRRKRSEFYAEKALGFCRAQIMRGANLDIVHFLLLWGQYLQGTQKAYEAWTIQGLTVKAAFQLGLNSAAHSTKLSALEKEIRTRTWLACVCLDRTMSMTFGRPAAIPGSYVMPIMPLPFPMDDDSITPMAEHTHPGNVAFFAATVKLYAILSTIIDQLYGQNLGYKEEATTSEIVTRIFEIEDSLSQWQQSLPEGLHIATPNDTNHRLTQQHDSGVRDLGLKLTTVLTLRYLNIRLLLHRPILLRRLTTAAASHENPMIQQLGHNSIRTCVENAVHILEIVQATVSAAGSHREILGAWWFSLYYTFNAALTVFACFLASRTASPELIDHTRTLALLTSAIRCLELLDRDNHTVDRCRHCLQILVQGTTQMDTPRVGQDMDQFFNLHDLSTEFGLGLDGSELWALGF